MAKEKAPEKLPPGIYRTASGYRVIASIGRAKEDRTDQRFKRINPTTGKPTTIREMVTWKADEEARLRQAKEKANGGSRVAGSLLDDIVGEYLPLKKAMKTYDERERVMHLWAQALGPTRKRNTIKGTEIAGVIAQWQIEGEAAGRNPRSVRATNNRHRTALMEFYNQLNGKSGYNPVRDTKRYRERRQPPPAHLSFELYERILAKMPDRGATYRMEKGKRVGIKVAPVSKTKLRLAVILHCLMPHEIVKQIRPTDIDWAGSRVYLEGRDKGEGTDPVWHPVGKHGLAALRAFADGNAFGRFSTSAMLKMWHEARAKVEAESPELFTGRTRFTPNKLRHLIGSKVTELADRSVASDLMLHTSEETTKIYTELAEQAVRRAALDKLDAFLDSRTAPPPPPAPTAPPTAPLAEGEVWVQVAGKGDVLSGGFVRRKLRLVKSA